MAIVKFEISTCILACLANPLPMIKRRIGRLHIDALPQICKVATMKIYPILYFIASHSWEGLQEISSDFVCSIRILHCIIFNTKCIKGL